MGVRKPYSLSLLTNPVGERQGAQLRFCFNFALFTRFSSKGALLDNHKRL
jgi:hypothetical protein